MLLRHRSPPLPLLRAEGPMLWSELRPPRLLRRSLLRPRCLLPRRSRRPKRSPPGPLYSAAHRPAGLKDPMALDQLLITKKFGPNTDQEMILNMGPQHPSTHGVINFIVHADGEIMTRAV